LRTVKVWLLGCADSADSAESAVEFIDCWFLSLSPCSAVAEPSLCVLFPHRYFIFRIRQTTLKSDLVPKPIFIHAGEILFLESVFRLAKRSFGVWKSASIVARNLLFRTLCKARVLACCSLRLFFGL
jgi:hypothetical protein